MDTLSGPRPGLRNVFETMDPTMRLLLVIGFIEMTAVNFYISVLMPYYRSLGFGSKEAGILGSVLQVVSAIVLTTSGFAADRLGRKKLYIAGQAMRGLVAGSLLITRNYAGLVMISVFRGLCSLQVPAQHAIMAECTEKSTRATSLAFVQTLSQLAGFIVPVTAGMIADKVGVRVPFTIGLTLAVLATVLGLKVREEKAGSKDTSSDAQNGGSKRNVADSPSFVARAGRIFSENNTATLYFLLAANLLSGLANGTTNILLPFTIMDKFSDTYVAVSGMQAAGSLGTMLVLLIGGRIADLYGRKGIVIWGSILLPISITSVFLVKSIWQMYGMVLGATMIGNISGPAIGAFHLEVVEDRDRASFSGLTGGLSAAGLALGSALAGFWYNISPNGAWAATILLFASSGVMYILAVSRQDRASRRAKKTLA